MSYFVRYKNGEHLQVWKELCALDSSALKLCKKDAVSVAREFVDRAYRNLFKLKDSLEEVGYKFHNPECVLIEANAESIKQIDRLEQQFGEFPLIARSWYERFKSVDFSQDKSQLEGQEHANCYVPSVLGLGMNPVLVFLSPRDIMLLRQELLNEFSEEEAISEENACTQNFLPTGGWASNCEPKGFWVPCERLDDVLYNDGAEDVIFASELRKAFKWGGFPFWSRYVKNPGKVRAVYPDLEKLLPILTNGIMQL